MALNDSAAFWAEFAQRMRDLPGEERARIGRLLYPELHRPPGSKTACEILQEIGLLKINDNLKPGDPDG